VGKEYLKLGRSFGAQRASSAAWVLAGSSSQERLRWWYVCEHVFFGEQAAVTAAALW
jgi:hypothetical protein